MDEIYMVEYALHYARLGFAVFPVCSANKKPHTPHGCKDAKTDPGAIRSWWSRWPDASIGIATGSASHGLVVIDLDQDDNKGLDGYSELEKWQKENGELPETWRSITGRGGYHLFFFSDKTYQNRAGLLDGIDVRGEGGYIIAPPSLHPNGRRYQWEISPEDGIPMAAVDETVDKLLTWKLDKAAGESGSRDPDRVRFELPATIPSGQRNDMLFRYACSLQAKGIPNDAIYDYVNDFNSFGQETAIRRNHSYPGIVQYSRASSPIQNAFWIRGVCPHCAAFVQAPFTPSFGKPIRPKIRIGSKIRLTTAPISCETIDSTVRPVDCRIFSPMQEIIMPNETHSTTVR